MRPARYLALFFFFVLVGTAAFFPPFPLAFEELLDLCFVEDLVLTSRLLDRLLLLLRDGLVGLLVLAGVELFLVVVAAVVFVVLVRFLPVLVLDLVVFALCFDRVDRLLWPVPVRAAALFFSRSLAWRLEGFGAAAVFEAAGVGLWRFCDDGGLDFAFVFAGF